MILQIEEGTTVIAYGAYRGNTEITEVVLPSSLRVIGSNAFRGCTSLQQINFPAGIEYVGDWAFRDCTSLVEVTHVNDAYGDWDYLGIGAFYGCSNLEEVHLGSRIDYLSNYLFYGCSQLSMLGRGGVIRRIGDYALYECESVSFYGGAAEYIGDYAFFRCTSLTKLVFTNTVRIGKEAFGGCSGITSVQALNAKLIGDYAFRNCASLSKAILGIALRELGTGAFSGCTNLYALHVPHSLLRLHSNTFNACAGADGSYFALDFSAHSMVPMLGDLQGLITQIVEIVPDNLYDEWKTLSSSSELVKSSETFASGDYTLPSKIRFNISDRTFTAEQGMTFREWVASPYNNYGLPTTSSRTLTQYGLSTEIIVDRRLNGGNVYSNTINWPSYDEVLSVFYVEENGSLRMVDPDDTIEHEYTYMVTEGHPRIPEWKNDGWTWLDEQQ